MERIKSYRFFFLLLHRWFSLLPQRLGKGQRQLLSPKWRIKVLKGERGDHYPLQRVLLRLQPYYVQVQPINPHRTCNGIEIEGH